MAAFDWEKFKKQFTSIYVVLYWIIGLIIAFSISYVLYTQFNKQVASLLVFMSTVLALYYYYVKWFIVGDDFKVPVGMCPDFMTVQKVLGTSANPQFVCIDTVGISPNFTSHTSGTVPTLPATAVDAGEVNATTGYVMTPNIEKSTDATWTSFCAGIKTKKLSWIGRCD